MPKFLFVELSVQESMVANGELQPPARTSQPMFMHHVLVHVQQVLDHKSYKSRDYLADIFHAYLGRVDGIGPATFRDGGHIFYGSRGRGRRSESTYIISGNYLVRNLFYCT